MSAEIPSAVVPAGVEIAYARIGSGPPLLLVHGITESRHSWDPLVPALATRFDVVAVDLRGHGESSRVVPFDVRTLADDLAALTSVLELDHPYLIGHSLGGVVVSALAGTVEPRAVVAVDQPLALGAAHAAFTQFAPLVRGSEAEFNGFIDALFASMDGPLPPAERARIREHGHPDQEVVDGIWAEVIDGSVEDLDALADAILGGITAPYLSLHGTDPGPGYADWLTARCPQARVELWPDHGHYPHLVDRPRFLARIAEFFNAT